LDRPHLGREITRNRNALFSQESCCKLLTALEAFSTCKAVDASWIPPPSSTHPKPVRTVRKS